MNVVQNALCADLEIMTVSLAFVPVVSSSVFSVIDCFHCINFMRKICLVYTMDYKKLLLPQDYNGLTVAKTRKVASIEEIIYRYQVFARSESTKSFISFSLRSN